MTELTELKKIVQLLKVLLVKMDANIHELEEYKKVSAIK